MPGRSYQVGSSSYRYSINGQEKTPEIAPNTTSALFWEYDSRIGRRWNVDPKSNVSISPFNCFASNPLYNLDKLGDSIAPQRTEGMNFIVVPSKKLRVEDVKDPSHGVFGSAYLWDYLKAKKLEMNSGGSLKVIEAESAQDAVDQIKGSLSPNQYVANLTIDFHRSSGPFDDPQFNDGSIKKAFKDLSNGYIGEVSNVYLGMCWAGGNALRNNSNLTDRASKWLDGATVYGHQAAASTLSFVFGSHFAGPVYADYAKKSPSNMARKGYHTISYYNPEMQCVQSVEIKVKVYILANGAIHMRGQGDLSSLRRIEPYLAKEEKIILSTPMSPEGMTPPPDN